jgi:hypothetical protein
MDQIGPLLHLPGDEVRAQRQRPSAAPRLRASHLAVSVNRELLLIPFELCPIDTAIVVILAAPFGGYFMCHGAGPPTTRAQIGGTIGALDTPVQESLYFTAFQAIVLPELKLEVGVMSDQHPHREVPTLEMRLAAIEDKLARLTVSEEEMAAYNKVAALTASRSGASAAAPALSPRQCTISPIISNCWGNCWVYNCINCHITPIIVNDCIQFAAGPASSGAGFSRLGGD